ncbi:hypothetical protein Tco_1418913 [Tanacetum coccineum]
MSISKRSDNACVCYTKPIDSLKNWNNRFFWVDDFVCPSSFRWHIAKNVTKDPAPVAAGFNAEEYATLVAHPSPFWKFPEEFLCLVGLSHHYTLDEGTYPLFLDKNGEGGCLLLFVCCIYLFLRYVIVFLTVCLFDAEMDLFAFIHAPDPTKVRVVERALNEDEPLLLHTTVGRTVPLLPVAPDRAESELEASVDMHFDVGGSGNQTEHGGSAGSGRDADIQLVSEATNTIAEDMVPLQPRRQRKRKTMVADAGEASHPPKKLRFAAMTTLPFITSSVSATPEHEDSSHHSGTNVAEAEVDSLIRSSISVMTTVTNVTSMIDPAAAAKEKPVEPLLFVTSSFSADGTDLTLGGFLDLTGSDFLIGGIRTVIDPDSLLQKISLSAKVRMLAEYSIKERRRLKSVLDKHVDLLKVREGEFKNRKAHLLLKETEAAEAIRLCAEASKFEDASVAVRECEVADLDALITSVKSQNDNLVHELDVSSFGLRKKVMVYEDCMGQLEKFQDDRMKEVNDKFDKLYADFIEIALHLEEKFYPYLLTTISGRRWLFTYDMELAITKMPKLSWISFCLWSGYWVLTDVAAYNPSAEDASVETLINILRLEETLAKRLGLNELQPYVDQLMVPIHHSPDKTVVGATALSLALDVYSFRVQRIRENIKNHRSALHDVFVPLAEPFSAAALKGTKGTSDIMTAAATTTALSTILVSISTVNPISIDDCEVVEADDQAIVDGNAASFANVDDVDLHIPQSTSAVLSVGIPISARMTASVPYVNENGVSSLLDFIMVRLRFALSSKPLVYGYLIEAKCWRIHSFSHQSLNGLSRNCFPLSEIISPRSPNL